MAELTIEPAETVRVRVERALAAVNLAKPAAGPDGGADRGDAPLLRRGGAERASAASLSEDRAALAAEHETSLSA